MKCQEHGELAIVKGNHYDEDRTAKVAGAVAEAHKRPHEKCVVTITIGSDWDNR